MSLDNEFHELANAVVKKAADDYLESKTKLVLNKMGGAILSNRN